MGDRLGWSGGLEEGRPGGRGDGQEKVVGARREQREWRPG